MAKPKKGNTAKPTPPVKPTKRPARPVSAGNPPPVVGPVLDPDRFDPDRFDPVVDVAELLAQKAELDALQARCNRIVILMMENRSFDHIFGRLGPGRGGLTGDEANLVHPESSTSQSWPVHALGTTDIEFSPPHALFRAVNSQVRNGTMGGFVDEFVSNPDNEGADPGIPMGFYGQDKLPAYDFLADNHLVFPRYFCSIQSGTWNNRMFFYAGTNNGLVDAKPGGVLFRQQRQEWKDRMPKRLLVDLLQEHGMSWAVYADGTAWMRVFADQNFMGSHSFSIRRFEKDCADGTLPSVVFIDPNFDVGPNFTANDDHPPIDLMNGQAFITRIYNALVPVMNKPEDNTVFVIAYDEHGGFYDHVPPPRARGAMASTYFRTDFVDKRGNLLRFEPQSPDYNPGVDDYGVRVPCVVVSKWAPGGPDSLSLIGNNFVLDHVSLHASIHRRFLPGVPMLSTRVVVAHTLGRLLTLKERRGNFLAMPAIAGRSARARRPSRARPVSPADPDTSFHFELRELARKLAR